MSGLKKEEFGVLESGEQVFLYTLTNANGMKIELLNYGATIKSILVADKNGHFEDVALGFDDIDGYLKKSPYFGCIVGRVANRIANGEFELDGKKYRLAQNNGKNALHGGLKGFDKQLWNAFEDEDGSGVTFSYLSEDGEEGYPGTVVANVKYRLTDENEIKISMLASTTKPTPISMANHCYFNLAGHDAGSTGLYDHEVTINADAYTPVDEATLIPTGQIADVGGSDSVFDLRIARNLGQMLPLCPGGQNNGYDHNFCINKTPLQDDRFVMAVQHSSSGRRLEVFSNQPGVQFYTGNFLPLNGTLNGKGGAKYGKHGGFCAETQIYPDAINQPNFPDPVIRPGQIYNHRVTYKFSTVQ